MPVISRFYGIVILMFFQDHHPPHFHAKYEGQLMEDWDIAQKEGKLKTIEPLL